MDAIAGVRLRFAALESVIDERTRRLLVAAESSAWGPGGISVVSQATGVSRQVIRQGLRELKEAPVHPAGRIRRAGGGRKKSKEKDLSLVADLERLESLSLEAIRNRVCGGPARVFGTWPTN